MNRQTFAKLAIVTLPFLLLLFFTFAEKMGIRVISIFTK
jgi:hypothetical protein